jgi:hypothetical protein
MSNQKRKTIPVSFLDSAAEPVPFFHVWLYPSRKGLGPSDAREPLAEASSNTFTLACSPNVGEKSIKFSQNALILATTRFSQIVRKHRSRPQREMSVHE